MLLNGIHVVTDLMWYRILIQGCNGTVLHTGKCSITTYRIHHHLSHSIHAGDMRAEPSFVNDSLSILESLKIRHLYMDTTFCSQQFDNFITKVYIEWTCDLSDRDVLYDVNRTKPLSSWLIWYKPVQGISISTLISGCMVMKNYGLPLLKPLTPR